MQNLYHENHKTLFKDTKHLNRKHCLRILRLKIVKMTTFSKLMYRFNMKLIKISADLRELVTLKRVIVSKIHKEIQTSQNSQNF